MTEKVFGAEKKGSIRDIPLPENGGSSNTLDLQNPQHEDDFDNWSQMKRKNRRSGSKLIALLLICVVLWIAYSFFFHSVEVRLSSKSETVTITSGSFTASVDPNEGLEFIRVNPFTKKVSLYVEGSEQENIQTKTSGTITVYNTDSSEKNYVKNTRFQSQEGLIYRAFRRFTIPAGTVENPGSVEVTVVAENPGENYNSNSGLNFVLPALKEQNDPSFELVSAAQTEPLTGGFSGVISVPNDDDIDEAELKLKTLLEQNLLADFTQSLPDNYIVNPDYITISDIQFTEKPNSSKGGLDLDASSVLNAVVFDKDTFEQYLATQILPGYQEGESVDIVNIEQLTMTSTSDNFDPESSDSFTFEIAGEAQFQWAIDTNEIADILAGKLQSHITNGLVNGLDRIEVNEVNISPFWRRTLPSDPSSIEIIVD